MSELNPKGLRSATSDEPGSCGIVCPNPVQDEVPDAAARFALALAASLALHLALILGIQIKAAQQSGRLPPVMEVRIERLAGEESGATRLTGFPAARVADEREVPVREEQAPLARPVAPAAEPAPLLPTLEIPLIEDLTWYPAKQVDVHPAALHPIKPDYPDKAAEQGVEGSVVLLLLIDEAGRVKEATVAEANPEGYFEASALDAFRPARFVPAQRQGRAVKSRVLIRVTYELTKRDKPVVVQP